MCVIINHQPQFDNSDTFTQPSDEKPAGIRTEQTTRRHRAALFPLSSGTRWSLKIRKKELFRGLLMKRNVDCSETVSFSSTSSSFYPLLKLQCSTWAQRLSAWLQEHILTQNPSLPHAGHLFNASARPPKMAHRQWKSHEGARQGHCEQITTCSFRSAHWANASASLQPCSAVAKVHPVLTSTVLITAILTHSAKKTERNCTIAGEGASRASFQHTLYLYYLK